MPIRGNANPKNTNGSDKENRPVKYLILSRSSGQGHNSAAKALQEKLTQFGAEADFVDGARFVRSICNDGFSKVYISVTQHAAPLFGKAYQIARHLSSPNRKFVIYYCNVRGAAALHEYIEDNGFDGVITTHLYPAETLTWLRRNRGLTVPTFFIGTDYTCIPFEEETELDYYFVPQGEAGRTYLERGIPAEKLRYTGIPVRDAFCGRGDRLQARAALGLEPDRPYYLIMSGSMGYGNLEELTDSVLRQAPDAHPILLGGSNQALKARLRERYDPETATVLDFTTQVPLYMDACDLLFTKPGGLTSTEAAAKNTALIHTKPIPGCETENARYFSGTGMSLTGEDTDELVARAVALANDPDAQAEMFRCQRTHINPHAADDICRAVLELTNA